MSDFILSDQKVNVYIGDCLKVLDTLPQKYYQTCVTSPPYFNLRDYGVGGQIGLENNPDDYIDMLVNVFRKVWNVLKDDGTLWLNIGDSYNANYRGEDINNVSSKQLSNSGTQNFMSSPRNKIHNHKPKDLLMIPARVALALQADGWYIRSDIIWAKPNPMPESVKDRPTSAHEHVFLLTKSKKYFYDTEAVKENVSPNTIARWGDKPIRKRPNGSPNYEQLQGENTCGHNGESRNL
ncbi:site-specific DNA-methyltransferase, partial [Methanohalobium sp.]|uniref:DNA-methyltransferase n=1 Tax=Methanohalobium sp. TaxID=2837493 RepID=UPI0025F4F21A